jgi:hypothetical protein
MDERERRIGLNEALFREVNEAVSDINADFEAPDFEIVCECGDQVIADKEGYYVVEKTAPESRALAERTDRNT